MNLKNYIFEKLRINKDTKSIHSGPLSNEDEKEIKNKMADIIKNYLQNNLNLSTNDYITDMSTHEYIGLYLPEKTHLNLDIVGDSLYGLLKPLCTKPFKVYGRIIYFYFT